jgi:glycosyltransferase involved in cell wall biosynthesis
MSSPSVSVVCTAFNHERYVERAVESALAQRYDGAVEVIVVDDGSTDGTTARLERFGSRIRVVSTENRGFVRAVDLGLSFASNEYVALLDGDDAWPEERLALQAEVLRSRPEVGLVHGDMRIVDEDERMIHPSFFASRVTPAGRGDVFGHLVRGNFVSGGASLFRASFLTRIRPLPDAVAWPDWWIAVRIGEVARIEHLDTVVNLYRQHGANMSLGTSGGRLAKVRRDEVRFRRWILANLADSRAGVPDLAACFGHLEAQVAEAAAIEETLPSRALDVSDEDRFRAAELRAAGSPRGLLAALGHDPFDGRARADLGALLARGAAADTGRALAELDARPRVVVAHLDELLAEPALIAGFEPEPDVTLVVDCGEESEGEAAVRLEPLLHADADVLLVRGVPADELRARAERVLARAA